MAGKIFETANPNYGYFAEKFFLEWKTEFPGAVYAIIPVTP
jgi:hypothetical protein